MKYRCLLLMLLVGAVLCSCRVTRHVGEGQHVVQRVRINVDGVPMGNDELRVVVAQPAYHRTFGFLPVSTWIYNCAGSDTTSRLNDWLHRVGTAPPVYDEAQTVRTERSMLRVLRAKGYLDATVSHRTDYRRKKVRVTYDVDRRLPMRIASVSYDVEDVELSPFVADARQDAAIGVGDLLDHDRLESERTRLTELLRDEGYWGFNKEHVRFIADTVSGSHEVDLTVLVSGRHKPYRIGSVSFITNFDVTAAGAVDTTSQHTDRPAEGYEVQYSGGHCYLRDKVLIENCFVVPGEWYSEKAVRNTYTAYSRLHILKYVNVRLVADSTASETLHCYIYTSPQNPHSVQLELDGTNSSGDLGFAAACTYQHRNLFRGSESYTVGVRGGYESLTGNVADLVNDNYVELTVENKLTFPKFVFPLLTREVRRRSRASTAVKASYSYQSRPEYTRIITNGGFSYNWSSRSRRMRHVLDVVDLSYVYLPKRSEAFLQIIQNAGPISYSSYQSHLIMAMGYNFYYGNTTAGLTPGRNMGKDVWSLRINPEVAGNVLQAFSHMTGLRREGGVYQILDLPFEQYARFDMDYAASKYLTDRSRLAFHLAGGVAVPYGNSSVMPFEKRYYSGGANSVRGWSVRTLGPGRYRSDGSSLDYFNQCGDVRLDASVELRSKLFWKFEFALFADGGNVWTLKEYTSQEGGAIGRDFYKEIAAAWGLGIRLVSDFFVLRFDMGVKAYDPTLPATEAWVVRRPWDNDHRTFHFAVGYPF